MELIRSRSDDVKMTKSFLESSTYLIEYRGRGHDLSFRVNEYVETDLSNIEK